VPSEIVLARSTPGTSRSLPRLPQVVPAMSVVDGEADREQFSRFVADYAAAWSTTEGKLDWERTLRLYAPPGELGFYQSACGDEPALRTLEQKRDAEYTGNDVTVLPGSDLHVTRNGNVAWTTGTIDVRTTDGDGIAKNRMLYMSTVWERRGARWVIVQEHLSSEE
jgi:ketosteroid isomerase-like protein